MIDGSDNVGFGHFCFFELSYLLTRAFRSLEDILLPQSLFIHQAFTEKL